MVSVYVRVGSFRMQINDRLHDINNMGPVMQLSSAEVSRLSVHQLDFHTQLEEGSGGGQPKSSEVCGALGVSHTAG